MRTCSPALGACVIVLAVSSACVDPGVHMALNRQVRRLANPEYEDIVHRGPNDSIRWARDCQHSIIGVLPFWGWTPSVEEAEAKLMAYAPSSYQSLTRSVYYVHTARTLVFFQECWEVRIRFEGIGEGSQE